MNSSSNENECIPNINGLNFEEGHENGDGEVLRPSVGSSGAESKKPTYVNPIIKSLAGDEVYFNITRNSQLKRVMMVSCDRLSLKFNDVYFLFESRYLRPEQTPDQLKMKNGDVIDAFPGLRKGVFSVHDDNQPTAPSAPINIRVRNNSLDEVLTFRMQKSTQLKKLMTAFCHQESLKETCVRFLFDGCVVRGNRTPDELGMEDGANIDAFRKLPYCDCCSRSS